MVRPGSEAERRQQFLDGLRFRAITATVFGVVVGGLPLLGAIPYERSYAALIFMVIEVLVNPIYWYVGERSGFPLGHFYFHWLVDLFLISAILHHLGGIDLPYAFLAYLMIVVTSATFISKIASFIVATGAAVATTLLVTLESQGVLPHYALWGPGLTRNAQIAASLFMAVFYYLFAYLSGTLSDQLKNANRQLESASKTIAQYNRHLAAEVAVRTEELQARNSEIEEFVHVVTHDLKNVTVGALELSRKITSDSALKSRERRERAAAALHDDLVKMNEMLKGLMTIFRAGATDPPGAVDLKVAIEAVTRGNSRVGNAGTMTVDVADDIRVRLPREVLERIIANVLDNAVKYADPSRRLHVRIRAQRTGGDVLVTFDDNGIGVAGDQRDRIFQLYHRAPEASRGVRGGTGYGVGLSLTRRLVERWGGAIWLEPRRGEGSRFCLRMPLAGQAQIVGGPRR